MLITTNGGQTYEVNTPEEVIELMAGPPSAKPPIPRSREQLLAALADLAAEAGRSVEAGRSDCLMLAAAILTVLNASRYPNATKRHLISLGQHMLAACEPLAE